MSLASRAIEQVTAVVFFSLYELALAPQLRWMGGWGVTSLGYSMRAIEGQTPTRTKTFLMKAARIQILSPLLRFRFCL